MGLPTQGRDPPATVLEPLFKDCHFSLPPARVARVTCQIFGEKFSWANRRQATQTLPNPEFLPSRRQRQPRGKAVLLT